MIRFRILFFLVFSLSSLYAAPGHPIVLETRHSSLVFSVGANQRLYQLYLGPRLSDTAEYRFIRPAHEAWLTAGMDNLLEPAIRMVHADGNPSLELRYVSHQTRRIDDDVKQTDITLKDPVYPVTVVLHFTTYDKEDVISSSCTITQEEKKPVLLTRFASAMLHLDAANYWLTRFHGDYAREVNMEETQVGSGIEMIDSKLGTRTDLYQAPFFLLSLNRPVDENNGEVVAGTLAWSGNFQFSFEKDQRNSLRLIAGMNPYASGYPLAPGEKFTTPAFLFTYSDKGSGEASRNLHRWARNYGVLDGHQPRLTLLNNWEATHTDFNETRLTQLFDQAADLGVDLFLLDDGWFGNTYPRDNDRAGLGDWQANQKKLPHGIGYLVKQASEKGIRFGIWLEPEMVNPQSELYHAHPDWILRLPNRDEDYQRHQLVLDLCNPAVQDFVYHTVDDLQRKNPGLAYIKWDCNRTMSNEWSPWLGKDQSPLFIDYTRGLYKVLERIRARYPHLPMMLCSGGGGRTDYGALKYFTEFWPSDDTDPLERVYIQWGYSYFFPANTIAAHVTGWGKESLKFKTDVAMMDKLGYDIRVGDFTPDERAFSRQAVQTYHRLSDVIWYGDLYRLVSPYREHRAALMYVSADKRRSVLFAYNLDTRHKEIFERVRLQGLDPKAHYRVREINLFPGSSSDNPDNDKVLTGDYLMKVGMDLTPGKLRPMTSSVFEITAG